jgi:hypothetical protein
MLHPRYIETNNRIQNENLTNSLSYKYGDLLVLLFYRGSNNANFTDFHQMERI